MPALYSQRMEIVIRKEEDAQVQQPTAETANAETGAKISGNLSASERFARVNSAKAFGVAREITNGAINYTIHRQGLRSGDQALADQIDRRIEIVQDYTSTASNIIMGATFGASGGVPGIAIGAALGAVSSVSSLVFKYANRDLEQNYKMFKLDNGAAYRRARAGINLTTGRLR